MRIIEERRAVARIPEPSQAIEMAAWAGTLEGIHPLVPILTEILP